MAQSREGNRNNDGTKGPRFKARKGKEDGSWIDS